MSVTNPWLTPYQRSYQQIKAKLIDDLKQIKGPNGNVLITDYSEGNILIMLISLFSAIAEVLHYYIDNMSRETFFSTARRFDSLVKHGELVDYHAHGAVAPTVDVIISRPLTSNYISAELQVSKGSQFVDNSGNVWTVVKDTKWSANTTEVTVPLIQHSAYTDTRIEGYVIPNVRTTGNNLRIQVPKLGNGNYYEHGTMTLKIAGESWVLVETFAFSGKFDKHFRTEVDANQNLYIVFGNGVQGVIPDPGYQITECKYYVTKGFNGNVASGQIVNLPNDIKNVVADAVCSNPYAAGGGTDYESFSQLKEHIPLHVRTLGVAITKQDFIDIAMQVPGVNKCAAEYECGRKLTLYITPDNGTTASSTLIDAVYEKLRSCAPLTTWLRVKSAGITEIILDITVTGRKSYSTSEIQNQMTQALMDKYSIENSQIGGQVRLSDIYALLDNLPMVDYLHINKFYIKPWPTTLYGNSQLLIGQFSMAKVSGSMTYYITFLTDTKFEVRANVNGYTVQGEVGSALQVVDSNNGNSFTLAISSNSYQSGYKYSIFISEPNKDYIEPGFNLPIFQESSQLTLTVNEVL